MCVVGGRVSGRNTASEGDSSPELTPPNNVYKTTIVHTYTPRCYVPPPNCLQVWAPFRISAPISDL